jgi:hypothetical protein
MTQLFRKRTLVFWCWCCACVCVSRSDAFVPNLSPILPRQSLGQYRNPQAQRPQKHQHQQRRPILSVLFQLNGDSVTVVDEASLIHWIKQANTTLQLDDLLRCMAVNPPLQQQPQEHQPMHERNSPTATKFRTPRSAHQPMPLLRNGKEMTQPLLRNGQDCSTLTSPTNLQNITANVAAAALRRITHIAIAESRFNATLPTTLEKRRVLLSELFETVGRTVLVAYRSDPNVTSVTAAATATLLVSTSALVDIVESLAILSQRTPTSMIQMQPLAKIVVGVLARRSEEEIGWLGPIRLVQCLQALAKLELKKPSTYESQLRTVILRRLLKSDATAKLPARSLSYGLDTLASYASYSGSNDDNDDDVVELERLSLQLSKQFMRRLRKQKVRETATIEDHKRALLAAKRIIERISAERPPNRRNDTDCETIVEEGSVFGYTTIQAILATSQRYATKLTALQTMDILSAWQTLRRSDRGGEDDLPSRMMETYLSANSLRGFSIRQLEELLATLEKLQLKTYPNVFREAGWRLLELVDHDRSDHDCSERIQHPQSQPIVESPHPLAINSILRCTALLYRGNETVLEPYLHVAAQLFTDPEFLSNCRVEELANFLWFLSMTHCHNDDALEALAIRILEPDIAESCTPTLASRILSTFVSILFSQGRQVEEENSSDFQMRDLHSLSWELFYELGGHLLSSKLSPAEASSALVAYAKASYVRDMGIYDHLVSLMASLSERCTVRQLAQSLWSCGKMVVWEREQAEEGNGIFTSPPYIGNAKQIAQALSFRAKELGPLDVAQCLWTLGRLNITDARVVCAFAYRAEQILTQLNSGEVANILWGLNKVKFNDRQVLESLSHRITVASLRATPEEAATVLFVLGTSKVYDEQLYDNLTRIMVQRIDQASAQAIANALWAHQAVQMSPPQQLLETWATKKIGIVGIAMRNPS